MRTLGISCFYHDSAVALVEDGKLVMALEEERFSRIKHDNAFPRLALERLLHDRQLSLANIDHVVFYEKPLKKLERALEDFVVTFPRSFGAFKETVPQWLAHKLDVERILQTNFGFSRSLLYVPHHLSHAAAAFYTSPFPEATVVTIDGVGEDETTCIWRADQSGIEKLASIRYPDSLGLLYSTITAYLGFLVNNEEYKVMALAALGDAGAVPDIAQLVEESADGSFVLADRFFAYRGGIHMWSDELEKLLGIPRVRGSTIEKRHRDIAAGLQKLTERVYAAIVREAYRIAPSTNLCLGGGVALNAVANGIVFDQGPFRALHIWGAAGDSGAACGAALYVDRAYSERSVPGSAVSLCVGTSYADGAYTQAIKDRRVTVCDYDDDQVAMEIARRVSLGDVVAVFDGPMEFGPRALGNRSLFAHPALASSIRKLHAIKARETYRPFGGIYFSDRLHEYAVVPHGYRSYPCMNVCLRALDPANIPAIVHVDGTCRVQTVERASDSASRAAHVLTEFEKQTGLGCILNTSFNTNGEPLVEHPVQAVNTFLALPIDSLFLGRYLLTKRTE